jgi:hypothetical protein
MFRITDVGALDNKVDAPFARRSASREINFVFQPDARPLIDDFNREEVALAGVVDLSPAQISNDARQLMRKLLALEIEYARFAIVAVAKVRIGVFAGLDAPRETVHGEEHVDGVATRGLAAFGFLRIGDCGRMEVAEIILLYSVPERTPVHQAPSPTALAENIPTPSA